MRHIPRDEHNPKPMLEDKTILILAIRVGVLTRDDEPFVNTDLEDKALLRQYDLNTRYQSASSLTLMLDPAQPSR